MAEVKVTGIVHLRITDVEWRLIMKSLALFSGAKVASKRGEHEKAAELNRQMLEQRKKDLEEQLQVAEGALAHAESWEQTLAIQAAEDPDGSAVISKMAYDVGRAMGRKEADAEHDG